MDELYWFRLYVLYVIGVMVGLKIGLTGYFRNGLEWKRHNAAVVMLFFVWPVAGFRPGIYL